MHVIIPYADMVIPSVLALIVWLVALPNAIWLILKTKHISDYSPVDQER